MKNLKNIYKKYNSHFYEKKNQNHKKKNCIKIKLIKF